MVFSARSCLLSDEETAQKRARCYNKTTSLVVADADVDVVVLQQSGDDGDVGLAVVVGEDDAGADDARGADELLGRHGVGLVAGQEGDVDADVVELFHLGDVLGVAGDVDVEAVDGEDEAVVAPLGMELGASLGVVVGGHGLDVEVVGQLQVVAVGHHFALAELVGAALVGNEARLLIGEQPDGLGVEVVAMLVGDEDVVGLGQGGKVDGTLAQLAHGVDLDFLAVVFDADAAVHEGVETDGLAALGLEDVNLGRVGGA